MLSYHRIAGEPEDERLDLSPRLFASQLQLLRRLRFHSLAPDELLAFHSDPGARLPRRSYVITADDGFLDSVRALVAAGRHRPQLFTATGLVGAERPWAPGARLATWEELASRDGRRRGGGLPHPDPRRLAGCGRSQLQEELDGSLEDLRRHLRGAVPILAYPHGRHDAAARRAAAAAGYRAAYHDRTRARTAQGPTPSA